MEKQKLNILWILESNSEVYSKASATKGVTGEFFYNYVKQT
jgi:hypothetical protein